MKELFDESDGLIKSADEPGKNVREIEEKLVDGAQEIEDKLDGDKKKEKYDFAAMIVEKELELIKTEWLVFSSLSCR